ncbi:kinesin-like protein KIFC2 isoform X11 [Cervus canadensis]|uniref:kinesin-like protein KIFC2 isoform X11 n=1 Tax=Cervus canadensis TaxID=1574408 RepID=UPI001C9E5F03|nr:kinesin-like protein KIFC2 isoform X11 [Cervus canadensis]
MLEEGAGLRRGGGRRSMRAGSAAGGHGVGAGTRGGVKPGPLPPRAPMYAFYSLLIYIFYSLFRRDGGAAAAADAENPAQSARCKPGSRRRADQPTAELWTELTGLVGSSEAEDGSGGGAERCPAEVSLEEALVRLAEFLSVQLGAEESFGTPPDLSKPGDVPPLLTVTGQLLALLAWIRSPRGRQALSQGMQPVSGVQHPPPAGSPLQEESPSLSPRGEAQGQQPPQLEEDQRAWQRLEQLILGQLEELKQQLEHQEEELGQLRLGVGATDSEKRVQHLTLENKALKQSLSLTRDLLLHWGPAPHTRAPQEKAEALLELRGRLQEAQDTTEALRVQAPQRSPALSHQGPPCPRASPAPGSEAGPSRPGGSPGGWPHPLGRAQPGVSAPGEAAQWGPAALQAPALTRTGGAGPAAGQPLSARPADAEPGEEQPGHRRHSHEPAQLSLARPGHADTAHSVPIARSWHRRHAAPRRPGGVRARLEGGGGRHIAGRPRRRPASTGGSDHQPLAAGAGRRDGRAAGPPAPRALPRLAAHTPTAAGAGPRRHGGAAAADLHAARGSRRDRVLAQVRRACEPSGVGAGQAPQGSPLRDTLLLEHRHTTLRDPLHPHDVARQPSKPRLRQRLQLGPGTAGGPAFLVLPKEPGSHLCGQRQQNPYSLMTSLISGDRCPPRQSPPSSPTLEECSAWGNDHTSPAPLSPSAVIAAHSRGSQGRRCRPRPSGHQSHYPITTLDLD